MENIGNLTNDIGRAKDTNFLEQLRSWFNTNNTSLTIICIVGLVLITIIIYFTRKVIHNRYSQSEEKIVTSVRMTDYQNRFIMK